jgi:hypothetical protein
MSWNIPSFQELYNYSEDATRRLANNVGSAGAAVVSGGQTLPVYFANRMMNKNPDGSQSAPAPVAGGSLTPAQSASASARDSDIETGQGRWRQMMADPAMQEIVARRKDMVGGLNAQEMTAARDQMIRGMQGQNQNAMRALYSQQARSGIRGGMAGAQAARMQQKFGQERAQQEQKLMLDNYALKRQGQNDYQDLMMRQKFGELNQGLGEAGLGVADRTGAQQAQLAQYMAAQANKEPQRGFLGQGMHDLGLY